MQLTEAAKAKAGQAGITFDPSRLFLIEFFQPYPSSHTCHESVLFFSFFLSRIKWMWRVSAARLRGSHISGGPEGVLSAASRVHRVQWFPPRWQPHLTTGHPPKSGSGPRLVSPRLTFLFFFSFFSFDLVFDYNMCVHACMLA